MAAEENAAAEDGNAELEEDEGERGADGDGLGNALPAARVKRIMRKNPDKKKNFSKECVLAVSMATVSKCPSPRPHMRSALNPGTPGMAPRAPRACAAPPEPGRPCCALAPAVPGAVPERHCREEPREHVGKAAQDNAAAGYRCVPCDRPASAPWSAGVHATVIWHTVDPAECEHFGSGLRCVVPIACGCLGFVSGVPLVSSGSRGQQRRVVPCARGGPPRAKRFGC